MMPLTDVQDTKEDFSFLHYDLLPRLPKTGPDFMAKVADLIKTLPRGRILLCPPPASHSANI
jgi:hypothetical protein